jgi:hypothetical protein
MKLPRFVVRQYKDVRGYNQIPPYFKILQVVLGIAAALTLAYYFLKPDTSVEQAQLADAWRKAATAATPSATATAATPAPGASPSTGASTDTGTATQPLTDTTGSTVDVPAGAVATAKQAATALFTGDFTTVNLADGVTAPAPGTTRWKTPQVADPIVQTHDDTRIVFAFAVDPDGPDGPEGIRNVTTTVTSTDGLWGYAG